MGNDLIIEAVRDMPVFVAVFSLVAFVASLGTYRHLAGKFGVGSVLYGASIVAVFNALVWL